MLPARYQPITNTVLAGGFGSVQPVKDLFLSRVVFFKSMHDIANNSQLINEIVGLSAARSRHVVEIYDVIKDANEDVIGIIIERLKGREFSEFHLEAKDSPEKYLKVLFQIATALADLHKAGVIHRDLKLDNFRESSAGILKLFDFGISVSGENYYTQNNRGTLVYAAPELYVAGTVVSKEMDVYALGVCAWALASQKFPQKLHEKPPQQSGAVESLNTVACDEIHPEIIQLLDSCLSTDPKLRPTAQVLASLLGRHLVRGHHKGLFVRGQAEVFELSNAKNNVKLKIANLGEIRATYDGIAFKLVEVTGSVFLNNKAATSGMELYESCLLTFGDQALGASREWVTFFASHPEVVL